MSRKYCVVEWVYVFCTEYVLYLVGISEEHPLSIRGQGKIISVQVRSTI